VAWAGPVLALVPSVLAKVRPFGRSSATSLPWILAVFALAAPDRARADEAPAVNLRHQVGFQAGGSGFAQVVYRYRFVGPLSLDVGALGTPPDGVLMNVSLGLVAAHRNTTRFVPYAGLGVGLALAEGLAKGCDPSTSDCPTVGDSLSYGYGRLGIGLVVDSARRHTISLDLGAWYGRHRSMTAEGTSTTTTTTTTFLWPMAGLSYLYTFRP
jgi:hypothetical protein